MTQGLRCCASPKIQSPPSSLSNHFLSPTPLSAALGAGLLAFECHFCVPALGWVPSAPCPVPDRHFVPCVPSLGPAPLAKPRGWREAGEKSSPLSISHVLLAGCGPSLPSLPCVRGSRLQTPARQPEINRKFKRRCSALVVLSRCAEISLSVVQVPLAAASILQKRDQDIFQQ